MYCTLLIYNPIYIIDVTIAYCGALVIPALLQMKRPIDHVYIYMVLVIFGNIDCLSFLPNRELAILFSSEFS